MIRRVILSLVLLGTAPAFADDQAPAAAPLDSLIWISETAAIDSLNSYRRNLEDDWYRPLTIDDLDGMLTRGRLDSLSGLGDSELIRMIDGRPWRVDFQPLAGLHFNRVEGFATSVQLKVDRPGLRQPSWTTRASYGMAWKRATVESALAIPLLTRRPRDELGRYRAAPWTSLALEAEGGRTTRWFAGDSRFERDLESVFSGEDPSSYFEQRWWETRLRARPVPGLALTAGVGGADDRPLAVATRWSLFGDEADVPNNIRAAAVARRSVSTSLEWKTHASTVGAELDWHRVTSGATGTGNGSVTWFRQLKGYAQATRHDHLHNEWVVRGEWTSVDHQAPVQWKTWLGGWGSLRGYEAGELVGDRGGWVSLDTRWNVDLFKTLRVPLLKKFGLQPVTFVEAGRTWNADGPDAPWTEPGWRADAGFGFSRVLGVGERGPESLRLYMARPVGQHMDDEPWRVVVAMEWW